MEYVYDNNNSPIELPEIKSSHHNSPELVHPKPQRKLPPNYIEIKIDTSSSNDEPETCRICRGQKPVKLL